MQQRKNHQSAHNGGKTDALGRKIIELQQNTSIQPPKPTTQHPSLIDKNNKNTNKPVPPPAEQRKLLQPVERDIINPDEIVGKETTITAQTEEEKQSAFYCKHCKVQLKDSNAWFDHINGKKHNQMLGMSMVVEKVGLDRVKAKLAGLKRKAVTPIQTIEDIERRLDEQEQQEREEKERKNKRKKVTNADTNNNEEIKERLQEELEFNEDDITAFGLPIDFGSSKRK